MNARPAEKYQKIFLERLSTRFAKRGEMVTALCEVLNVGRDAVYRRLRGDTVLSADELILLARTYGLKLDERDPEQGEDPAISFPPGMEVFDSEVQYFQGLEEQCRLLVALPDVEVNYATPELPLYYELTMPTLLAFKTYNYGLTTWNFQKWKGQKFRVELIDPELFRIAERLKPILFSLAGKELWSVGILDVTLRQIMHAAEIGTLDDVRLKDKMFEEIEATIRHMEHMTKEGKRFYPGELFTDENPDFRVYHNELANTNNVIIIKSAIKSYVYSTFVNPNYLVSTDYRIQRQMQTWFDNLLENSNSLGLDANKYSQRFFANLRRTVKSTKARVDTLF